MNMHSSSLSPILSNDSSASNGADYASGLEEEPEQASEERRRLLLARAQCRTPSTGSQVSELADELAEPVGVGRQRAAAAGPPSKANKELHANGVSLASQYLFNRPHPYLNNPGGSSGGAGTGGSRKFRQLIQSIPLPLVATSIITVFILCLLLSECKSLQVVSPKKAVQSLLLAEPTQAQLLTGGPAEPERPEGVAAAAGLLKLEEQLALKRDLISDLMHQRRFMVAQQASEQQQPNSKQRRTGYAGSGQTGAQQEQDSSAFADTLGAILFGSGLGAPGPEAGAPSDEAEIYIDGEPSGGHHDRAQQTGSGEADQAGRPANLRSSQLELDLSEESSNPRYRAHQQQQPNSASTSNNNNRHQQAVHKHSAASADQMKQQQHYQQQFGNNHDRPFDVAQIRKYTVGRIYHARRRPTDAGGG